MNNNQIRGMLLSSAIGMGVVLNGGAFAADLTVGAFGGAWGEALQKCVIAPFEKKTGKKVEYVIGSGGQWVSQIAANPTKPPLDVIYNTGAPAFDAIDKGLVDKFDLTKVPSLADLPADFANIGKGYGAVHNYGSYGLIYNTKAIKEPPKDWKEFVDGVIAGKYRASIPSINFLSSFVTPIWFLSHVYGGGVENIEPGLAQIKKMKASGNLVFWDEANQVLNNLKSGDIDIAIYADGRAWSFVDGGNPEFSFARAKPGSVIDPVWIQKVKNGSDLGWDFVNWTLSAEAQACFGNTIQYAVANSKAELDPKVKGRVATFEEAVVPPFKDIPAKQSKWVETWNKEIGR